MIGNHASGVCFVRTIAVSLSVIDWNECPGAMTGTALVVVVWIPSDCHESLLVLA